MGECKWTDYILCRNFEPMNRTDLHSHWLMMDQGTKISSYLWTLSDKDDENTVKTRKQRISQ